MNISYFIDSDAAPMCMCIRMVFEEDVLRFERNYIIFFKKNVQINNSLAVSLFRMVTILCTPLIIMKHVFNLSFNQAP